MNQSRHKKNERSGKSPNCGGSGGDKRYEKPLKAWMSKYGDLKENDWMRQNKEQAPRGTNRSFLLYTALVRVNRYTFQSFGLGCKTRQGGPLSLLLWTLTIEPVAQLLKGYILEIKAMKSLDTEILFIVYIVDTLS